MTLINPILDDAIRELEENYANSSPNLEHKLDVVFEDLESAYYIACMLEDKLNLKFEEEYGSIRIGIHKLEDDNYELRLHYSRGPHYEY